MDQTHRTDPENHPPRGRWSGRTGLLCAGSGATLWAVALTMLQPGTEPAKPWHDAWAENNTYWVRDIRWMALLAVLAGLLVAFRGDWRLARLSALGVTGWLALDLWLDRIDVTGPLAAAGLAGAGWALIGVATLAGRRRATRPSPALLLVTAAVAATLAPVAGLVESPTDTEPGLNPATAAAGLLLALAAIGAALGAAATPDRARLLTAAATALVAGAGLALLRSLPPGSRTFLGLALGALLLVGVTAAAGWLTRTGTRRDLAGYAVLGGIGLLGYPLVFLTTLVVTGFMVPVAAPLTALAGNPPVNDADTDALYTLVGLVSGLVFAVPLAWLPRANRAASDLR